MCNLERFRSNNAEVRRHFDIPAKHDRAGNLMQGNIYPRQEGPIVRRTADGDRALVRMNWGFPLVPGKKKDGTPKAPKPVTNVRNTDSRFWLTWLGKPEHRCLGPLTAFAEPGPHKDEKGHVQNEWFGLTEEESLFAFAGIWRTWDRDWDKERGRKETDVYAFLTTEPNAVVKPIHKKAMPVIVAPDDYDTWLTADWTEAKALQRPFPAEKMTHYKQD